MTGQCEIRPSTAVDAPALSLLGQATFLEAFAGILDGPDILAHCARAPATSAAAASVDQAVAGTTFAFSRNWLPGSYFRLSCASRA